MESDPDFELEASGPLRYFVQEYLDNPIVHLLRDKYITVYGKYIGSDDYNASRRENNVSARMHKFITQLCREFKGTSTLTALDPAEYQSFLDRVEGHRLPYVKALRFVRNRRDSLVTSLESKMGKRLQALRSAVVGDLSNDCIMWGQKWRELDLVVGRNVGFLKEGKQVTVTASKSFGKVVMNSDCVAFSYAADALRTVYIMSWDQMLMFKDMSYSRFQVLGAAPWIYPDLPQLPDIIIRQWTWQMECLVRYGNEGYEIAKGTEAISKAYLTYLTDDVFVEEPSFRRMVAKVRDKERGLGATTAFQADKYEQLLLGITDLRIVVELFGLQKLCGHPLIDPRRGGRSAAEEARSRDTTLYKDSLMLTHNFCHIYLVNYVAKEGRWPPLQFTDNPREPTQLHRLSNIQFRNLSAVSYPLSDWMTCRFLPHHDFHYYENYLELLDDKSMSYTRSDKHCTWYRDQPTTHKRVLLEALRREGFDAREVMRRIGERDIPDDWKIVSLYPKEREFKLAARMFSMLVFEIRFAFTLLEANLADTIFQYLPQQTMTKDKQSVQQIFGDLTRPNRTEGRLRYYLEIDLSRWNLKWRKQTVHSVGDVINDIFGVPGYYTFAHEFFEDSLILVRYPGIEPEDIKADFPPESDVLWYHHYGGFEGICQKHWSACTYSMVDLALKSFDLTYVLIGQGDNCVVALTLDEVEGQDWREQIRNSKREVLNAIENGCNRTNQDVKQEECLESTTVLTYSKDIYINGVDYHTVLKAHSRLFPHASSDFPSVMGNIGSIFGTAKTGAEKTRQPLISYFIALFQSALYLETVFSEESRGIHNDDLRSLLRDHNVNRDMFIQFCLLLPPELGGLPIGHPAAFFYKGSSDPLSHALASVKWHALSSSPDSLACRILADVQAQRFIDSTPKREQLLEDPFGIPITRPVLPNAAVGAMTRDAMSSIVRNKDVSTLWGLDVTDYEHGLRKCLLSMTPLYPLIGYDLVNCSVVGVKKTMESRFTSTQSVQGVARLTNTNIVERLLRQELHNWSYLIRRFKSLRNDVCDKNRPIYQMAVELRKAWKLGESESEGPAGVTTYHPFDFDMVWGTDALSAAGICIYLNPEGDAFWNRGAQSPYMGSSTREKKSEHGFRIAGTDPSSEALRKLQLIASQIGDNEQCLQLIDSVARTRGNITLSEVSNHLTTVVGGTISHRYASKIGHIGAHLLGSFTFSTHCVISSNRCGFLSGGYTDYPVMFQEFFLYGIQCMALRAHSEGSDSPLMLTLKIGEEPLDPIPSARIALGTTEIPTPITVQSNKLVYADVIHVDAISDAFSNAPFGCVSEWGDILPSKEFARLTARAWFRFLLSKNQRSKVIADSDPLVTHRPLGSLDLAEALSLGIYELVQAAAFAIAEETVSELWRVGQHKPFRWTVENFSWKLSNTLALTIAEHIGHPALINDPYVLRHSLYPDPASTDTTPTVVKKITGILAATSRSLITNSSSDLYTTVRVVFLSEGDFCVSSLLTRLLTVTCHRARLLGDISERDSGNIMTRFIVPLGRKEKDEKGKISEAQACIRTLIDLATANQSFAFADELDKLVSGARIKLVRAACEEILRQIRDAQAWSLNRGEFPRHLPTPTVCDLAPWEIAMPNHCQAYQDHDRLLNDLSGDVLEQAIIQWANRTYGLYDETEHPEFQYWKAVLPYFRGRTILSVNNHSGFLAAMALDQGARAVYGLDKRSALPVSGHAFRDYKPPRVYRSIYELYFQHSASWLTDGRWETPSTAEVVLDSLPEIHAMLYVDIDTHNRPSLSSILRPLMKSCHAPTIKVAVQLLVSRDESLEIAADIMLGGGKVQIFRPGDIEAPYPTIFWIISLPRMLVRSSRPARLLRYTDASPLLLQYSPAIAVTWFNRASLYLILYDNPPSLTDWISDISRTYTESNLKQRERVIRDTHQDLNDVLISAWWANLDLADRKAVLISLIRGEEQLLVDIEGVFLLLRVHSRLLKHLVQVVNVISC